MLRRRAQGWLWLWSACLSVWGLDREVNQTLRLPLDPPVKGYAVEPAFGDLRFTDPAAMVAPPGETNRLFVVEQRGRIAVITNLAAPNRTLFLDIASRVAGGTPTDERGMLGLAFHPGYATNRQFFVFYSTLGTPSQRVSRFEALAGDPNRAATNSEVILINQEDQAGNHNGGDLHFGNDGYLYVSLGDEGNQNDALNNSQRINKDFFSGILRLDVDRRPGNLAPNPHASVRPGTYLVPADNPWVGATSFNGVSVDPATVRTEFWAVGLRNPWRMSFDPATGDLWVGDVGGDSREEINWVTRGGNYGWAYREGTRDGPKVSQAPAGFVSLPPIAQYSHGSGTNQGRSVTGGIVYRGQRLSQLAGAYLFADYLSGNIWALRPDGTNTVPMTRLTGRTSISAFGRDPRNGDVLMADQGTDQLLRLTYSGVVTGEPLPATLADTGAFADLAQLTPQPGIVPYEINVPFWSDHAIKQRWFAVTEDRQFLGFDADGAWSLPVGMVWIKHFDLELTQGDPASRRRVETRFLVRNSNGVHGLTYRWTTPPTNAVLVPEEGLDEPFTIADVTGGIVRTQVWHYPGRAECLQCHTPAAGWALGFNTQQLNRGVDGLNGGIRQIEALAQAGYFTNPPAPFTPLRALTSATDESVSVEWRVRSWLDANCSGCHRPGGTALGAWDARARTPLSGTGLVDGLLDNDQGDPLNRLIVAGSVAHSMVHTRIQTAGPGRMPPLASSVLDDAAAELLRRWINEELPKRKSFAEWQREWFGDPASELAKPEADADGDGAVNELEFLTGTDPRNAREFWTVGIERERTGIRLRFQHLANRGFVVEWSDAMGTDAIWRPLAVPENQFRITAAPFTAEIVQPAINERRYYRVRVFEP
ncbi:MAG: PQQ-dependent sugar dehydrogenase [Verrucomicrobiales bacterium]|nr:PQQ-dependent sugar dehydrogenase [Verrucomicrobiales bacterium]